MDQQAATNKNFSFRDAVASLISKDNVWFFPLFFFILNLVIKSVSLTKVSFDLDEAWHTYFSQKSPQEILKIAGTDPNGPFFNLILHYWIKWYGVSEMATRTLSLIFSAATAPLLFILGKKYFNSLTGIFTALIFSFTNLHFFFSHNARVYALICFLAVLSLLFFFRIIKTKRYSAFIFLIIINTMLLYTHLTTYFLMVAEGLAALIFLSESKKGALMAIGAQFISVAFFVPWILLTPYYHEPAHGIWLHAPDWEEVKKVLYDFCGTQRLLHIFIALFILSLVFRQKNSWRETWKLQLTLLLWFCVPLICSVATSYLLVPVFQTKYVMISSLGLYMLTAYSVSLLRTGTWIKFFVVAYLVVKLYPTIGWQEFISEDWRSTVNEVKKHKTDRTMVIVSPWYMHYPFCYYYNRDYYVDTEHTLQRLSDEKIFFGSKKDIILSQPTDYDQVILITTHEQMVSPDSMRKHLKDNFLPVCDTSFPSIKMYCFMKEAAVFRSTMEAPAQSFQLNKIVEKDFAHSGAKVSMLDGKNSYSATFEDRVGAFSKDANSITACGWVYYQNKNTECVFVVSFENKNGSILYKTINATSGPQNKWFRVCQKVEIPEEARSRDIVKVYFWNKSVNPVYVDDMEVAEIK